MLCENGERGVGDLREDRANASMEIRQPPAPPPSSTPRDTEPQRALLDECPVLSKQTKAHIFATHA